MKATELNWPPDSASPCPANHFNMSSEQVEENRPLLLSKWEEWSDVHPDDPTGEVYLAAYEDRLEELQTTIPGFVPPKASAVHLSPPIVNKLFLGKPKIREETFQVRLIWNKQIYEAFREYCSKQNRSMSEVTRMMIANFLQLTQETEE